MPNIAGETASGQPLISCVLPTYDRRRFIPLALQSFLSQDYPNKELLVLDDGTDPVGDLAKDKPGVRYIRLPGRTSLGVKRRMGCEMAKGAILAQWDDDDWYSPTRLSYQVAPLLEGTADMAGLENTCLLVLPAGEFWTTTPKLHRQWFVGGVLSGNLMFLKSMLGPTLQYADKGYSEDELLMGAALRAGKRLARLANPGTFVYVRHRYATSQFVPGRHLDPAGWSRTEAPPNFTPELLALYRQAAIDDDLDKAMRAIAPAVGNLAALPLRRIKKLLTRKREDNDDDDDDDDDD